MCLHRRPPPRAAIDVVRLVNHHKVVTATLAPSSATSSPTAASTAASFTAAAARYCQEDHGVAAHANTARPRRKRLAQHMQTREQPPPRGGAAPRAGAEPRRCECGERGVPRDEERGGVGARVEQPQHPMEGHEGLAGARRCHQVGVLVVAARLERFLLVRRQRLQRERGRLVLRRELGRVRRRRHRRREQAGLLDAEHLGARAHRPAPRTVGSNPRDEDRLRAVEPRPALEPAQPHCRAWRELRRIEARLGVERAAEGEAELAGEHGGAQRVHGGRAVGGRLVRVRVRVSKA